MTREADVVTLRAALGALSLAAACAVGGWLAIWLPWQAAWNAGATHARNPIDGMQPSSMVWLALIGLAAGVASPRFGLICAPAAMLPWVGRAIWEMGMDPTSHNLFPFEFAMYGVFAVGCSVAAWLGGWLGRLLRVRSTPPQ